MENKTAMTFLIEKILRMPESNIKGFLKISGPAYLESEKEQIKRAYNQGVVNEISIYSTISEEQYYSKTYGTGH